MNHGPSDLQTLFPPEDFIQSQPFYLPLLITAFLHGGTSAWWPKSLELKPFRYSRYVQLNFSIKLIKTSVLSEKCVNNCDCFTKLEHIFDTL